MRNVACVNLTPMCDFHNPSNKNHVPVSLLLCSSVLGCWRGSTKRSGVQFPPGKIFYTQKGEVVELLKIIIFNNLQKL